MKTAKISVGGSRIFLGFEAILEPFGGDTGGITATNFVDLRLSNKRPLFEEIILTSEKQESLAEKRLRENRTAKTIAEMHDLSMMMHRLHTEETNGVKAVYEYLTTKVIPILNEMIEDKQEEHFSIITFSSPLLHEYAKIEEAVLALNENRGPLTDATSCKRCGALKVHRRIAQTRSADEGFSSIFICPQCSFSWVEN
uniref:TFIIS-type domain-containing protein n=1 Tax=viral metagenome TaxID=1070528 RepID=A0A6C0CHD9_9ZZZZ